MRAVHLDDVKPGRPEGVDWLPLRAELGIGAFGVSAYRANAGELVVPRHNEAAGGGAGVHEELYVVLSGRATFTVGGETVDAPAGTLVHLPDPTVQRKAIGEEAGTTVLAIGATRGRPFAVSPWERRSLGAKTS